MQIQVDATCTSPHHSNPTPRCPISPSSPSFQQGVSLWFWVDKSTRAACVVRFSTSRHVDSFFSAYVNDPLTRAQASVINTCRFLRGIQWSEERERGRERGCEGAGQRVELANLAQLLPGGQLSICPLGRFNFEFNIGSSSQNRKQKDRGTDKLTARKADGQTDT